MTNTTFPILTPTNAENIDADGNVSVENQMLTVNVAEDTSNHTILAVFGFLFTISLLGGLENPIFFIFSPIFFLLLIGSLPKRKKKLKVPAAEVDIVYVSLGQEIEFVENGIYINSPYVHEENIFFHKDIQDIKFYFMGITDKNSDRASYIHVISKGKTYSYYFWIDSDGSRMRLIEVLKRLYGKEMAVTEYKEGRKTYLLGDVSAMEIDSKVQSLIDEIGEKEDKSDRQLL